jgi:hypothetical protein
MLKEAFIKHVPLVIHWDGKLLPDLTNVEKVDRLPVLVSGKEVSKLLTVAKLSSGAGESQASAVYEALNDWNIADMVRAMCFDTTASNTGHNTGACVLLERKLGRELMYLACRHHIMEVVIGKVFQVCMGSSSSGPEVLLFKRFKERWHLIDKTRFQTGIDNENVACSLLDVKEDILEFCNKQLVETQPRDDYREFVELTVIFLGGVPVRGIRFIAPGAMHHARWL